VRSEEIREKFLEYFEKKGHRRVISSSLIPGNDPTLLFTNAGMNQFKEVFLGNEKREYKRATSCQKCLRAGGKHNDLDNVGKTNRHHTFFEMLGNFSFGDYFKEKAIEYAWELLINFYKIKEEALWVSVYEKDEEAFKIWNERIGLAEERIKRLGLKDNFWAMGETGPCGPCSEIYYDQGKDVGCKRKECDLECECDRYLEFWNLVFMEFNRNDRGELEKLPSPSIDTGMGLERIAALLQNKKSNYESDLFIPLINEICDIAEIEYPNGEDTDVAVRVAADHSRAVAFLIAEGIVPSNEGRGYILRRIIRRASRYGKILNLDKPYLYKIAYKVSEIMGNIYPELIEAKDYIAKICYAEEERFYNVISVGILKLEDLITRIKENNSNILPGEEAFKLYDTFGLPLDLIEEISAENNLKIDYEGYEKQMEKQRAYARASWKGSEDWKDLDFYRNISQKAKTEFLGYEFLELRGAKVVAIIKDNKEIEELKESERGELILDKTVFYGESGGQIGDQGYIKSAFGEAIVEDTKIPISKLYVHKVIVKSGKISKGDLLDLYINRKRRYDIMRNHTATHLLNAALRQVLGTHIKQSGSLVSDERFRFDFTHFNPLSGNIIKEIERIVNEKIRQNLPVNISWKPLEKAFEEGTLAFFGEKYEDIVRVVSINDFSKELCGGTHCSFTGEIGLFVIIKESSVAAGIRRIEALTGKGAFEYVQRNKEIMQELSETLKVPVDNFINKINYLIQKNKELEKQIEQLKMITYSKAAMDEKVKSKKIQDIEVVVKEIKDANIEILRNLIDEFKNKRRNSVGVFGSLYDGRAYIVIGITPDLKGRMDAYAIIKEIAPVIGGGGGGRSDFAQASGKKTENLSKALEESIFLIERMLSNAYK